MAKQKDTLLIELKKNQAEIYLKLTASKELEEFFKTLAVAEFGEHHTETSKKWFDEKGNGLDFYFKTPAFTKAIDTYINGKIIGGKGHDKYYIHVINDFGKGLFEQGQYLNIAVLRTVGISKGILLKSTDLVPLEEVRIFSEQLLYFTTALYDNFLASHEVEARLRLKI